jgi:ATP-dependent exoDNAse (exonuclease V) alpha subunit
MSRRVLEVKLIGGEHDGQVALIPRITLSPTEGQTGFAFVLKRRQFPVRLAFALTINKSQGQSVKHVGIDLRVPVFSHGQLYVALSRATNSQNIRVLLPQEEWENHRTQNVVYPEVLVDTVRPRKSAP